MLAPLLVTCLAIVPQEPLPAVMADAVAVRGDAELDPATAFASAKRRAEDHVRGMWSERAERAFTGQRPFWLPELLAQETMRRWLADLPVDQMVRLVDREDRERTHEFGNSYQTTLWVAEDPRGVQQGERQLRRELRDLEKVTAIKYGGVVGSWVLLAMLVAWIDRLSRGYMTGRLRLLGLLCGLAVPAVAFLV
jgi:hypothetical protein